MPSTVPDLSEVRGQELAKRALEVAAAGGHNLLFIGPPGSGKTMLARRLPGLLPPLTLAEAIAVTKIHSLVAEEPPAGLIRQRPFRSPHTGTSTAGLIGGGSTPRPGEASLAHNGVLFLDELPEFRRDTLEALRQPLEEGHVTVVRARARLRFPARFSLLAAMNPCPCGHLGDPRHDCRCPPPLDRALPRPGLGPAARPHRPARRGPGGEPAGAAHRGRREPTPAGRRAGSPRRARSSMERFGRRPPRPRSTRPWAPEALRRYCVLDHAGRALLDAAFEKLGLSARALDRILKVARTIADLGGSDAIRAAPSGRGDPVPQPGPEGDG